MELPSLFKTETREVPAEEAFNVSVCVCAVEDCEEEFSDEKDARKHYVRNHLSILCETKETDVGTFMLFPEEDAFRLFTEFSYLGDYPWWEDTEWKGPGWYCFEYGYRDRRCSCRCLDDYALLTKATTWLWSKSRNLEMSIKRKQENLQKCKDLLEEMDEDTKNESVP